MLSEAFLSTVLYQQAQNSDGGGDGKRSVPGPRKSLQNRGHLPQAMMCGTDDGVNKCGSEPSLAIHIPSHTGSQSDHSPDLYTSWSSMYATLYQNYPDLHIRGDHILIKKDSGCVLDLDSEDGPVLLSVDIDSSSPPEESLEGAHGEEEPLSRESHALPSAPFSNSAINGFLEKKMQELYKQCYEETLEANGSPGPVLWHNLLLNINHMSLLISQEKNLDQARVRDALMQGVYSRVSSEFTTPVLHISSQGNKKRSGTLSNVFHLRRNSKK
ncbi:TLR adapter interacting with SLC15A4 on the lysosome-like [Gastrophryne carolinensis]